VKKHKISVIVPTFNEAKSLRSFLSRIPLSQDEELIVSDGGSSDSTVKIAREFTDKVYVTTSGKGRGHAMNYGAERAGGDILIFLHADCILPGDAYRIIHDTVSRDGVAAGAFDLSIACQNFTFRIIEFGANVRSRFTSIPYGDQGIFIRKEYFERLGGFADLPLMEDIEIARRIKKMGKIVFVRPPIIASPRRWLKEGALYTTLRDWAIAISYRFLGASPETLKQHYKDIR
jgi:rSAM/selenodomain-associated transferase 2